MANRIVVSGMSSAIRKFRTMPEIVQLQIVEPAMEQAMRPMLQRLRSATPRRSGALKASATMATKHYRSRTGAKGVAVSVRIGKGTKNRKAQSGKNGKGVYYGRFPEFGTKSQPATHFAKNVYTTNREQARADALTNIRDITLVVWASI